VKRDGLILEEREKEQAAKSAPEPVALPRLSDDRPSPIVIPGEQSSIRDATQIIRAAHGAAFLIRRRGCALTPPPRAPLRAWFRRASAASPPSCISTQYDLKVVWRCVIFREAIMLVQHVALVSEQSRKKCPS